MTPLTPTLQSEIARDLQMKRAHRLVAMAIERGDLVRPDTCEACGDAPESSRSGTTQIQGHHHRGYDRPLEVEWLCQKCHTNRHKEQRHPPEPDPLGCILEGGTIGTGKRFGK